MKLAVLSDIHANIQGMDACLRHARERGARQFAILGDLVGYGADPVAVVQRAQDLASHGALMIKGNHDDMAVNPPEVPRTLGDSTAGWTHAQLSADHRGFLDALPMSLQHGSLLLVHASADEPASWPYIYDDDAALDCFAAASEMASVRQVFVGHVHHQTLYSKVHREALQKHKVTAGEHFLLDPARHWLATIGSAGQPRDGNPQAMYALYDTESNVLDFQRVAYDHSQAANAIRHAGLPPWLALRLEVGR